MKFLLPPPLTEAPPPRSPWGDFKLLLAVQLKVTWNKIHHWPRVGLILMLLGGLGLLSLLVFLGSLAYGALDAAPTSIGRNLLSMIFMGGFAALLFFGVTSAFASLYMADDLEILFMTPVSTRIVFATKLLSAAGANFLTAFLFVFLPALFYGLLLSAGPLYYLWAVLVGLGLWSAGTALAGLFNLLLMRIIPPHRSREAVGMLGAIAGITIALIFQIPNLLLSNNDRFDPLTWLSGQQPLLTAMDYFPWGWGSLSLAGSASGNQWAGLGWSLLLLLLGIGMYLLSFLLVEKGFRRGWISLEQGGGKKIKRRSAPVKSTGRISLPPKTILFTPGSPSQPVTSPALGMIALAKKELLYLRRDTREWFSLVTPLIIIAFFIFQSRLLPGGSTAAPLVTVLVMYTIIFSGNLALQSFGREGESEWLLNSIPLAGWPVVWGKLLGVVLPTLVLMEIMLVGTALATGFSPSTTLALAVGALFITLSASAIGLFFSIHHSRYNPESPRGRIAPGPALLMALLNMLFMLPIGLGLVYLFPPAEIVILLNAFPASILGGGSPGFFLKTLYLLSRPLFWSAVPRVLIGTAISGGVWAAVFFGFLAGTVHQSQKGFKVEIITARRKKPLKPL